MRQINLLARQVTYAAIVGTVLPAFNA